MLELVVDNRTKLTGYNEMEWAVWIFYDRTEQNFILLFCKKDEINGMSYNF